MQQAKTAVSLELKCFIPDALEPAAVLSQPNGPNAISYDSVDLRNKCWVFAKLRH